MRRTAGAHNPVSSSQWQSSDDEGVELAGSLASALREKRKVWTALVTNRPDGPAVVSLHATEEEAIESIEERFGDDVERTSEGIVTDLENWGYTITVDVHEV